MRNVKILAIFVVLAAGSFLSSCGGGGGSFSQPPQQKPAAPTVKVSPSAPEIKSGDSLTLTISSTNASSCSMSDGSGSSQTVPCNGTVSVKPTVNTIYTVTATGDGGNASDSVAILVKLEIKVSASTLNVNVGASVDLTATIKGGDGQETIKWSANPVIGNFSSDYGTPVTWMTPLSLPSSPEKVAVTATATDGTGSSAQTATATVTITVTRVITLSLDSSTRLPNNEVYLDFGTMFKLTIDCSGCEAGDTQNVVSTYGGDTTTTYSQAITSFQVAINETGDADVPGPIFIWFQGSDGVKSNTLRFIYDGSQNEAVQNSSTGEVYYYNSGNGSTGSGEIVKLAPDGTVGGDYKKGTGSGDEAIAFDGKYIYLASPAPLTSTENGIDVFDASTGNLVDFIPLKNGEPGAISASNGLVCATIPTGGDSPNATDAVDCHNSNGTFPLPSIQQGSEPTAVKVLDANDVVVFGRGDSTLRAYTISGAAGTAEQTLKISQFTNTDAAYWKQYPATGGWEIVSFPGSSSSSMPPLAVQGRVVNGDGTTSQELALISGSNCLQSAACASYSVKGYMDLPAGTIHIAADSVNSAVVAEYWDSTVSPSITQFKRMYVDTGNSSPLASTSVLVPGAGFLFDTWNGVSNVVVCVEGKCDFLPQ